jgi:DNA-binding NarL/FixJ family response regulator
MMRPTVILADDHTLVVEGFRRLLEEHCTLLATVGDGRALLETVARQTPDIVILDISMPVMNGIDAARQLKATYPELKLVFVTMHADSAYIRAAFKAGASAYLLKGSLGEELGQALRTVQKGGYYVTPLITKEVIEALMHGGPAAMAHPVDLTVRQREVLQLLAEGYSAKDIAGRLNISPRTVEFHKAQLMEQLDLHSTIDLVKYALANGLVGTS